MVLAAGQTSHRIAVGMRPQFPDPQALRLMAHIREFLNIDLQALTINKFYLIKKELSPEQLQQIAEHVLADPILEQGVVDSVQMDAAEWTIEVTYKKGMTDNAGNTAQLTIEDYLGTRFERGEAVSSGTAYLLSGSLSDNEVRRIAEELIANPLIEEIVITEKKCTQVKAHAETIDIAVSDDSLQALSKERCLALSLQEMKAIQAFYAEPETMRQRKEAHLPPMPTDVEIEALAQTWSEHCKHKIFNAKIHFQKESIDSLFKTYIKAATDKIAEKIDWLVSVFTDNAGILRFNNTYNIAFKVETHNSPSALDPYGGALTGILGVNRDIMGAGSGARLLANTNILCFASPCFAEKLPARLLHPKRIFEGVRRGIEHGGNKTGVPTVNGAIVFDDRYLGKPLVYCGTVGIMPAMVGNSPTHHKAIVPGDLIVVAGGRTGRDGIHGATFSSEELNESSPSTAVQIGDPFTQKKLQDMLLEARDAELFRTLTDNGAGGLSSSVGELAQLSNGCEIHLDKVPLKSITMRPWEILVSESQERMTLAVPLENMEALETLAAVHEIEIAAIGTFTATGKFHILFHDETVGLLPLDFLHNGVPQLELEAEAPDCGESQLHIDEAVDHAALLLKILGRYNICSKEHVIRQYDHEVQGGSAMKPLVGLHLDGPGDAAIVRPLECLQHREYEKEGVVIANGLCPKFSAIDCYHMAASAIDEALRNYVAVGGDPTHAAILDNFCWPDPVYDKVKTPDGKLKLAQLVLANKALYDYATAYSLPIISGKDSMKNDYKIGQTKISVPPTLLISIIGKIHDVETAVSMDFKFPGDLIYVVGVTQDELGGSEFALMQGLGGGYVPKVDAEVALHAYHCLYAAIQEGLIASCHDCSDGGLAVALAECAFSGGLGADIRLKDVPVDSALNDTQLLFSESNARFILSIDSKNRAAFEHAMNGVTLACIGETVSQPTFTVTGQKGNALIQSDIQNLKAAWQAPLLKVFGGHA